MRWKEDCCARLTNSHSPSLNLKVLPIHRSFNSTPSLTCVHQQTPHLQRKESHKHSAESTKVSKRVLHPKQIGFPHRMWHVIASYFQPKNRSYPSIFPGPHIHENPDSVSNFPFSEIKQILPTTDRKPLHKSRDESMCRDVTAKHVGAREIPALHFHKRASQGQDEPTCKAQVQALMVRFWRQDLCISCVSSSAGADDRRSLHLELNYKHLCAIIIIFQAWSCGVAPKRSVIWGEELAISLSLCWVTFHVQSYRSASDILSIWVIGWDNLVCCCWRQRLWLRETALWRGSHPCLDVVESATNWGSISRVLRGRAE